jgi:predicted amidophosphoribosyltransferase
MTRLQICEGCHRSFEYEGDYFCSSCLIHVFEEQCGACGYDRNPLDGCVCSLGWHEGGDWARRLAA